MSNFHPPEVVVRGNETHLQVGENLDENLNSDDDYDGEMSPVNEMSV